MLRVHHLSLGSSDPEKRRIKLIVTVQEAAPELTQVACRPSGKTRLAFLNQGFSGSQVLPELF